MRDDRNAYDAVLPDQEKLYQQFLGEIIGNPEERFTWYTEIRFRRFLNPKATFAEYFCSLADPPKEFVTLAQRRFGSTFNPGMECTKIGPAWTEKVVWLVWDSAITSK